MPGGHLLREVAAWRLDNNRPHYDVFDANELAESAWFRAQRHPLTGKPLRVERLALPPGSLVSFIHHMPHDVRPCPVLITISRPPSFNLHESSMIAIVASDSEALAAEGFGSSDRSELPVLVWRRR